MPGSALAGRVFFLRRCYNWLQAVPIYTMNTNLPVELIPYQETLADIFVAFEDVCLAVLYRSHARGQAGLEKQS